ncbi:MAG: RDD family protein, partial [Candidatus Limnocylindrales bacterium]
GGQYSVPGAPGLVYAGAIPRAAAFIVDSFLLSIVVAIVTIPFAVSAVNLDDLSNGALNGAQFMTRTGIASIIGVLIEGAYFAFLWMSTGRATLGMRLFSLQVGDVATGSRLRPDQAVKRWLAYGSWVGALALAPAIAGLAGLVQFGWTVILLITTVTSPTKQGLHDRFAGSAVVRPASAGNGLALTCLVVALILPIVVAVLAVISLIALGGQVSNILSAVGDSI